MSCSFEQEYLLAQRGITPVAGVDEAGRGPLAGPVFAAAVILPLDFEDCGLDDSKKLSPQRREELYTIITATPGVIWACAFRDHLAIDRVNILRATHEAMREAILSLAMQVGHALIDGLPVPRFPCKQTALVGGDGKSFSIAAASIIAKIERDRVMKELDRQYPEYGFWQHKGYATPEHLAKLRQYGPCPIHRRSFEPVAQGLLL